MYWPKFSERKLFLLLKKRKSRAGCAANYVRWTKTVGLKIFMRKKIRNRAHKVQKRAAEAGLGPAVGGDLVEFEIILADWDDEDVAPVLKVRKFYGYFTEHAPPAGFTWDRGHMGGAKERQLFEDLQRIGIYHGDLHGGNVSLVRGSKKPICIDFGPESCYLGRRRKNLIERHNLDCSRWST